MLYNGESSPERNIHYFGPRMIAKFLDFSKAIDGQGFISAADLMINIAENIARAGQVMALNNSQESRRIMEWQEVSRKVSYAKNLRRSRNPS